MNIWIIGAWPGGLSAALILQKQWHNVTLYEKENFVGWRNGTIEHNGFRHDIGPTFLMYPEALESVFKLAGEDIHAHLNISELDPMYKLTFPSGTTLELSRDRETMIQNIEAVFPWEGVGYRKYMETESARWNALKWCLEKPYSSWTDLLSLPFIKGIPHFSIGQTVHDVLSSYFTNDEIKLAFSFQSKYLGMSPWVCPWAFTMLAYLEHGYGIWHVEGWLSRISEVMADIFVKKWGNLKLNTPVLEIVQDATKARWVRTNEWEQMHDTIIMNADFSHGVSTLFQKETVKKYSAKQLEKKGYSCSTFMVYLELDTLYKNEPHHHIIFSPQYKKSVDAIAREEAYTDDFSVYVRNASIHDSTLAPEWKSELYLLVPISNTRSGIDWENLKESFTENILQMVMKNTSMKDLKDHIEYMHVITPNDWEKRWVYNWATFNLAHSLDQMLYFRPRNKFECLENCYLVWGWTHPGSGLPTIYQSAIITADMINQQ